MMRKAGFFVAAFLPLLAGCTDSMESITRELRNANNEAIDALTMVTSEEQARRMNVRVFKPMMGAEGRFKTIEGKLKNWKANRSRKEIVEETFKSIGFYLYVAELEVNKRRFNMERQRLRRLYKEYQDLEPDKNPAQEWPNLTDLVVKQSVLKEIETQLKKPELKTLVDEFPDYKGIENYKELYENVFVPKMIVLAPEVAWRLKSKTGNAKDPFKDAREPEIIELAQ